MAKTYTPEQLWDELGLKEKESWIDFKKRLLQDGTKPIVYEMKERKMLNIYVSRGFKKMLTENGDVTKKRFIQILKYFSPIVHKEKEKYASDNIDSKEQDMNEGFTLTDIVRTLELPAFLGPASDDACKKYLQDKPAGDHCYRFSSSPGQFVLHVMGNEKKVLSYKMLDLHSSHKLVLHIKNGKKEFKTLAELEQNLPEWKNDFEIPFIAKVQDPFETLDEKEKDLLEWCKQNGIQSIYSNIIQRLSLKLDWEESLNGFANLREDPNFQSSIDHSIKEKIDNAVEKEQENQEKKPGISKHKVEVKKKDKKIKVLE